MNRRDYLTYSLREYILLGRLDAINGYKKDIKKIIKTIRGMGEKYTLDRVINYLLGFELGTIEVYLLDMKESAIFNAENCTLIYDNEVLPNEEQKSNAKEEAQKLVRHHGAK